MINKLTYQRKTVLLAIGCFLFIILAYNLSISKTFELANECEDYENQLEFVDDAPRKIAVLQKDLASLNETIGSSISSNLDFQDILLEEVSNYCNKSDLVLKEFPHTHSWINDEFEIQTNVMVVQGPFVKLVRLIHTIEDKYRLGKMLSVKFTSKKDNKMKKYFLDVTLYFQNIKKTKELVNR